MRNHLLLIVFVASLAGPPNVYTQSAAPPAGKNNKGVLDSLMLQLRKANSDTSKISLYYSMGIIQAKDTNFKQAEFYADNALTLSNRLNYNKGIGQANDLFGEIEIHRNDYKASIPFFQKSLNARTAASDKAGVAYAYMQLGRAHESLMNDSLALHYFSLSLQGYETLRDYESFIKLCDFLNTTCYRTRNFKQSEDVIKKGLKAAEIKNDKQSVAHFISLNARLLSELGNYPKAISEHLRAEKICREIKDSVVLSDIYQRIGAEYFEMNDLENSIKYWERALPIRMRLNQRKGIAQTYASIGDVYKRQRQYSKALLFLNHALKIFNEPQMPLWGVAMATFSIAETEEAMADDFMENNQRETGLRYYKSAIGKYRQAGESWAKSGFGDREKDNTFLAVGRIYLKLKKIWFARNYVLSALAISTRTGVLQKIEYGYLMLAKIDSATGDYKSAFENYTKHILYKDSINLQGKAKEALQVQMTYEFDAKEAAAKAEQEKKEAVAAEELQQQKLLRNGFVGGSAVLLVFSAVFFSQRNKIAKGKKLSDALLLNILPKEVADELKVKGEADAKLFDEVTVLFTDFVNFTVTAEKMSPAHLVAELHDCFKAFDEIIGRYDIEKVKTIGDAYLAVCGLPHADAQHARKIVQAALEIKQFMAQRKQQLGDKTFDIRIGAHSGPVVAGIVGVKKFAYDIWGDTVNTAARLEQSSQAGKINISEATYALVKDDFECSYRGEMPAKNKGMMKMYFVGEPNTEL